MKIAKYLTLCICFALLLMNTQCDEDDFVPEPCDQVAVIDNGFYQSAESNVYTLTGVEVNGDCLTISLSASGCDGSTWSMVLVDSGDVSESLPEQRSLKFVFSNTETCLAVFGQERSFDLRPLQVEGSNEVILNIEDFPEPITYAY
ncbi:hypothetical protein [Psychroserpens luteolus]|uniref:hypothetical protein n=1 Tax=Psychroserpens luteolus TaxID=2855840 RepID=UPI001E5FBACF|nr:hypothetical protein [Psychroserpens luteolus]MCD2260228.1 hypothetical protein [Psychroserpens luteolus]